MGAALVVGFPFCGPRVTAISTAVAVRGTERVSNAMGFFHIAYLFGEVLPKEKLCRGLRLRGAEGMELRP